MRRTEHSIFQHDLLLQAMTNESDGIVSRSTAVKFGYLSRSFFIYNTCKIESYTSNKPTFNSQSNFDVSGLTICMRKTYSIYLRVNSNHLSPFIRLKTMSIPIVRKFRKLFRLDIYVLYVMYVWFPLSWCGISKVQLNNSNISRRSKEDSCLDSKTKVHRISFFLPA